MYLWIPLDAKNAKESDIRLSIYIPVPILNDVFSLKSTRNCEVKFKDIISKVGQVVLEWLSKKWYFHESIEYSCRLSVAPMLVRKKKTKTIGRYESSQFDFFYRFSGFSTHRVKNDVVARRDQSKGWNEKFWKNVSALRPNKDWEYLGFYTTKEKNVNFSKGISISKANGGF